MKYRKKILSIIVLMGLTFSLYFVYLFGKTFFWDNTIFEEPKVYVYINNGDDFSKVISAMTPLLKSISDFSIAAQKKGYTTRVRSGKFVLLKGSNNNEIINTLRGKSLTVRVTFNNQERIENLAGRVARQIAPDSVSLKFCWILSFWLQKDFPEKMHWECICLTVTIFSGIPLPKISETKCGDRTKIFGRKTE